MSMSVDELKEISLRSLFNKVTGFREKERAEWERVRIQTYLTLSPYMDDKNPMPVQSIWPMPWDGHVEAGQKDRAKEARDKAAEGWAKIDEWRAKNK